MEEWAYVDPLELQNWKGSRICMTCRHFVYGVGTQCVTLLGCNTKRRLLNQGDHLTKRCSEWAPVHEMQDKGTVLAE